MSGEGLSQASTATLNGTGKDADRPAKIKWTFIDERADIRLGTACRKMRDIRRERIQSAEINAIQS